MPETNALRNSKCFTASPGMRSNRPGSRATRRKRPSPRRICWHAGLGAPSEGKTDEGRAQEVCPMQAHLDSKQNQITLAELESRVPAGSASSPSAKFAYRLCAPLRWWSRSTLRIVALELCSFPLRMAAILRTPSLREGVPIPLGPLGYNLRSFGQAYSYLHACTQGMQCLQSQRRLISPLDLQIYAQAFQRGATWAAHKSCSGKSTESP